MNRLAWYVLHGFEWCRKRLIRSRVWEWHMRRKLGNTEWMEVEETRRWITDMLGSAGCHGIPKGCDSMVFPLTEGKRFTLRVGDAVLMRVQPFFIPHTLFLEKLCDELYAARGKGDMMGDSWHLGVNEDGELCVHAHQPVDITPPRPYRERAKVVRLDLSRRPANVVRFSDGKLFLGDDDVGEPDSDMLNRHPK